MTGDSTTNPVKPQRVVRSFVQREGRITQGQRRALAELWPRYGIEPGEGLLDFEALFGRRAPVIVEIGFGNGEATARIAAEHPENDYIGIEVHRPGVGSLLLQLDKQDSHNVRIISADAVEVLTRRIADGTLAGVHLFFPDPWPKKRHHKRRIVQPAFLALLRRKLKPGGYFHMATDWQDYAESAMQVLEAGPGFVNKAGRNQFAPTPAYRPETKFERRGQRLGHGVWDLVFRSEESGE